MGKDDDAGTQHVSSKSVYLLRHKMCVCMCQDRMPMYYQFRSAGPLLSRCGASALKLTSSHCCS